MRRILICLTFLLATALVHADQNLQTYTLNYRQASDLAREIGALYPADEVRLAARGNLLTVRAAPALQAEISAFIEQMDRRTQQYLIRLRETPSGSLSARGTDVSGTVSNNGSRVVVTTGNITSSTHRTQERSIRVSEGELGFLGESRTLLIRQWNYVGGRFRTTEAVPIEAGMLVQPQASGDDRVALRIENKSFDDNASRSNEIRSAGVSSTLTVPLGEWVSLGGTNVQESRSSSSWTSSTGSRSSNTRAMDIRVDLAD